MCHKPPVVETTPSSALNQEVFMKKRMEQKTQEVYLEGLKKYHDRGVRIVIDGEEAPTEDWDKIFVVGEDGGFYMGDYVGAAEGRLTEIRFDKVYNQ